MYCDCCYDDEMVLENVVFTKELVVPYETLIASKSYQYDKELCMLRVCIIMT